MASDDPRPATRTRPGTEGTTREADPANPCTRLRLGVEYVVLFFALVACWALPPGRLSPMPPLIVAGAAAAAYLWYQPGYDRRELFRSGPLRAELRPMLALWLAACALAVVLLAAFSPDRLFALPRHQPLLWAAIVLGYPLLSVYPQELIFRGFLMRRYRPVFGTGATAVIASAAAFGFAHVIYGNITSVVLSVLGGVLFARRYRRTRSLLIASIEHALYGIVIFTVGLGDLFYRGDPPLR